MGGGIPRPRDNLIPFYSEPLERYFYQWLDVRNGIYVSVNFALMYVFYWLSDFLTADIYLKGTLLLVAIRTISAWGIYKLIKMIYGAELGFKETLAIVFYLISPAYYNGHIYWIIFACIPWFFYFVVKIIKNREITYFDILAINVVIFCSTMDLPNPKYLFYLCVILFVSVVLGLYLKKIDLRFLFKNKYKIALALSISSYIIIPQYIFALNFDSTKRI